MSGASNEFGLDAGFGERNSLGFGFMDVRNHFSGAKERNKNYAAKQRARIALAMGRRENYG